MTHYHCNFKLKNSDKFALVKCPDCSRENYCMNVLSGICTWCGYDINGEDDEIASEINPNLNSVFD